MLTISREVKIPVEYEAKLKRLADLSGKTESEWLGEKLLQSIESASEDSNPIIAALRAQGLLMPREKSVTREEAQRTYEEYLALIGSRHIGLTQAVLEDRR